MKKMFAWLFPKKEIIAEEIKPIEVEHKTFNESGEFIKANIFEQLWITENVSNEYGAARKKLPDRDYLDFKLWEDMSMAELYKKHIPNAQVFIGKNPNIIFHGGCLGCMSQRLHGLERCMDCKYFKGDWNKPDLKVKGEECAKMSQDDLNKFLNS